MLLQEHLVNRTLFAPASQKPPVPAASPVRSPESELLARISAVLQGSAYPHLRQLQVAVDAKGILLRGTVSSYFLKQTAQTAVLSLRGGRPVHNQIQVEPPRH